MAKTVGPSYYKRIRKARKMDTKLDKLAVGPSTSKALQVNMVDVKKILINAAMTGAATTVLYLSGALTSVDFGAYTPIVVPMISAGLDFLYRYLKNNTPKE